MQTIRTIFWALTAAALAIFAVSNWVPVEVSVWPGFEANTWLPVIILISFLIGFLPPYLAYAAQRWTANRTIAKQEQVIADLRTLPAAQAPVPPTVVHTPVDTDPVTGSVEDPPRTTPLI